MHLLAVLVKLLPQLRNDCPGRCSVAYLKTHFWERAGCAFSENRVPSDIADVPSWRIHGRAECGSYTTSCLAGVNSAAECNVDYGMLGRFFLTSAPIARLISLHSSRMAARESASRL
jgi:hypothetical protein